MSKNKLKEQDFFTVICDSIGLKKPVKEYKFCSTRRWRADYCWTHEKIIVELEGAIWTGGRHVHPVGFKKDMEKYNSMAEDGWTLLRYDPNHIDWEQIKRVYYLKKVGAI
jgi:very-short-patch-repair endonuclease